MKKNEHDEVRAIIMVLMIVVVVCFGVVIVYDHFIRADKDAEELKWECECVESEDEPYQMTDIGAWCIRNEDIKFYLKDDYLMFNYPSFSEYSNCVDKYEGFNKVLIYQKTCKKERCTPVKYNDVDNEMGGFGVGINTQKDEPESEDSAYMILGNVDVENIHAMGNVSMRFEE